MRISALLFCGLLAIGGAARVSAADLQANPQWASLASDRLAATVGDSLTVLIYQDASASNSAKNGSKRATRASGEVGANTKSQSAHLDVGGSYDGRGETGRSDRMVAQVSVVVVDVLPNGDLRVAGEQALALNGERTHIKISGRVRPVDISSANTVLSTRLADATIDYNGAGFVTRSSKPGILNRVLGHLGLF